MQPTNRCTQHGVFLSVFDTGVLITGKSGIGKSEVALSLLDRGHALIADDIVELTLETQHGQPTLVGRCPPMLQDFLEVRGLGILPIRALFGGSAICPSQALQLIVEIIDAPDQRDTDRVQGQHSTVELLGMHINKVGIPVNHGRPLCVIVETAVRLHQLKIAGFDTHQEIIARSERALQETREPS